MKQVLPGIEEDASSMSDTDGEGSKGGGTIATSNTSNFEYGEGRDEVKEIQNMSRVETRLIRTWRVILLVMLVIAAAAVSSITYVLLRREENAAYKATVGPLFIAFPIRIGTTQLTYHYHLYSLKNSLKLLVMLLKLTTRLSTRP
jgi:hypothetical protein